MTGYMCRVMAAYASGLIGPGEFAQVHIEHDTGCDALSGGDCRCIPTITVTTNTGVIHVEPDGTTRLEAKQ
jgi:hypothetical protein